MDCKLWPVLISFLFCINTTFAQIQISKDTLVHLPDKKFINRNIVGIWKDETSTMFFRDNGLIENTQFNGRKDYGMWEITEGGFKIKWSLKRSIYTDEFCLLSFTKTSMSYRRCNADDDTDTTVSTARKSGTRE